MPSLPYKPPPRFPGVSKLPPLLQQLVERTFPPDQVLPTAGMPLTGVKLPYQQLQKTLEQNLLRRPPVGGLYEVVKPTKIGYSSLFRTGKTPIPAAPATSQEIDTAFDAYRALLGEIFKRR